MRHRRKSFVKKKFQPIVFYFQNQQQLKSDNEKTNQKIESNANNAVASRKTESPSKPLVSCNL